MRAQPASSLPLDLETSRICLAGMYHGRQASSFTYHLGSLVRIVNIIGGLAGTDALYKFEEDIECITASTQHTRRLKPSWKLRLSAPCASEMLEHESWVHVAVTGEYQGGDAQSQILINVRRASLCIIVLL